MDDWNEACKTYKSTQDSIRNVAVYIKTTNIEIMFNKMNIIRNFTSERNARNASLAFMYLIYSSSQS
jgi:hypothetical protein